jgi:hypothetical protein
MRLSRDHLGIDAQRAAVARFAAGESHDIVAEFVEIETGKGADARSSAPATRRGPPSQ